MIEMSSKPIKKINLINIVKLGHQNFSFKQLSYECKLGYKYFRSYFNGNFSLKVYYLPKNIKKFTVIRSPFVFKKVKEQFEVITYKNLLVYKFFSKVNILSIFNLFNLSIKKNFSLFKVCFNHIVVY
jgi:hypothetical protein